MVRHLLTTAIVALSVSTSAMAQDAFSVADAQLNQNYQALMNQLPASAQESLRDTQRLWLRYNDANCELKLILDEKAFTSCKTDATLQRARELANLLLVVGQDAPQVSPAFVAEMKEVLTNLEAIRTSPEEGIYWPGGSAHTIVTQLLKKVGMNYVVQQYGQPVFVKGPHTEEVVDLESTAEFGYYDPAFLSWLNQQLDTLLADQEFIDSTQPMIDRYLLSTVELYLVSFYYLQHNPEIRDGLMLEYLTKYQNGTLDENHHMAFFVPSLRRENPRWDGKTTDERYIWYYPAAETQFDWILTRMNEEWEYVPVGSALMFWMRRAIDGTDQQFVDLFTKFYQGYDAEKYERNIDQRLFSAPKNLPFGEIQF